MHVILDKFKIFIKCEKREIQIFSIKHLFYLIIIQEMWRSIYFNDEDDDLFSVIMKFFSKRSINTATKAIFESIINLKIDKYKKTHFYKGK